MMTAEKGKAQKTPAECFFAAERNLDTVVGMLGVNVEPKYSPRKGLVDR